MPDRGRSTFSGQGLNPEKTSLWWVPGSIEPRSSPEDRPLPHLSQQQPGPQDRGVEVQQLRGVAVQPPTILPASYQGQE